MIRPTQPEDVQAILAIAHAAIGFEPEEQAILHRMLKNYLAGQGNAFWLSQSVPLDHAINDANGPLDGSNEIIGAAYCAPEAMTHGTWNLLFIAIHPTHQNQGYGTALLQSVEQRLKPQGRLLLVETLASFTAAQSFYNQCGYRRQACIQDYYDTGQDKIVFSKLL